MLTIKQSMELAGRNLLHCLRPEDQFRPLWGVDIEPDFRATCRRSRFEHNVGRWWDAVLRLEAATGFEIPAEMEAAMLRNLGDCLDNPLSVCAPVDPAASCFDGHTQREILLALSALVRWRDNDWAKEAGHRMILALDRFFQDNGEWNLALMNRIAAQQGRHVDATKDLGGNVGVESSRTHGRMIEGLLEFYMSAGDTAAMRLATRLAEFHLETSTRPDGSFPETDKYVHTHSLLGTYRGLLLYGKLTRQWTYIDRIAKTYANTVRTAVKESGFISHDWGNDNTGEPTSPGDAAQLALWLARLGYGEFLDDVERIVRARLLPSQITEPLGLHPAEGESSPADLDDLAVGAFGGMHALTHGGKRPTTDITAAILHTLCDIYSQVIEERAIGMIVNFHFDYDDARIRMETTRTDVGRLVIQPKIAKPITIRIPTWAPAESVRLAVNGRPIEPSWVGRFLMVSAQQPPARIEVEYGLPVRSIDEHTDGVDYRITWRGDDVIGIAPNTDFLPFYPTMSE